MQNNDINEMDRGVKLVFQELKGNPYKKFNIAFALMSVIPFLVFVYILAAKLFTIEVLAGDIGLVVFLSMAVSFCGFYAGYGILKNIINKIVYYAAKAKHGDQMKSEFVASVSHELKNPLTTIKMNLSNIKDGVFGPLNEDQEKAITLSQGVIDRMTYLINDLLDIHKIEAGRSDINRKLCSINNILEKQAKEFEGMAGKKNIRMIKDISDTDLFIWADEDKIGRVINNLLSNAIKYTPDAGFVKVRASKTDGEFVRMEVEDTAPAISYDHLNKIFDKFERLNNKGEGTGLGLAIAKDIVELHKGKIWAERQPERGNRFIVILPRDLRSKAR